MGEERPLSDDDEKQNAWQQLISSLNDVYFRLHLKHVLPVVGLVAYTCLGAVIFMHTERDVDLQKRGKLLTSINLTLERSAEVMLEKVEKMRELSEGQKLEEMRRALLWFSEELGMRADPGESPWHFWGSFFFAGTIYTTIGYGNYSPTTTAGRIAVMFYAMIGVPLVLTILGDVGRLLIIIMRSSIRLWWRCFHSFHNFRDRIARRPSLMVETVHDDHLPITGAVILLVVWMGAGSALFTFIEPSWTYFECMYFFFVSLTTIGFGDFVPEDHRYAPLIIPLLIVGLSVISMCINIIQTNVYRMFKRMMHSIDREYRNSQAGHRSALLSEKEENEAKAAALRYGQRGSMGLMKLYKTQKSIGDRILFRMMDKNLKSLIQEHFDDRASMVNRQMQTVRNTCRTVGVQAVDEEEEKKKNRKYIYNIDD